MKVISPERTLSDYLKDISVHKALTLLLAKKFIIRDYSNTLEVFLRSMLLPFLFTITISLTFGTISNTPSASGNGYYFETAIAVSLWLLIVRSTFLAAFSIKENLGHVKNYSFPLVILPALRILSAYTDFLITFAIIIFASILAEIELSTTLVMIPVYAFALLLKSLGAGLFLSITSVRNKTAWNYFIVVLVIIFTISPIGFSLSDTPEGWMNIWFLNPVGYILGAAKSSLIEQNKSLNPALVGFSISCCVLAITGGIWALQKKEPSFRDSMI